MLLPGWAGTSSTVPARCSVGLRISESSADLPLSCASDVLHSLSSVVSTCSLLGCEWHPGRLACQQPLCCPSHVVSPSEPFLQGAVCGGTAVTGKRHCEGRRKEEKTFLEKLNDYMPFAHGRWDMASKMSSHETPRF